MERVQKLLAAAGVSSRRGAERLIRAGRVTVNGDVVTLLGTQADPARDVIAVDGEPLSFGAVQRTLLLNKPVGYVTTRRDPQGRPTVMELVPDIAGLHPIGRLDQDTTGLLLLTTDGDLTYALTHPKHHVDKTYRAWVQGMPSLAELKRLAAGIALEDGMTAPAQLRRIAERAGRTLVEIVIHEGRKRQVKRMFLAIGTPVISLQRTRLGPLTLGDLPEGAWRELTGTEVRALFRAAGTAPEE